MTATHLFRGNDKGEILDASGQVVGRIVPVEPTESQTFAGKEAVIDGFEDDKKSVVIAYCTYIEMLSAAPTDWSGVAVRVQGEWKCGNELALYHPDASHINPEYRDAWNHILKAIMGAK